MEAAKVHQNPGVNRLGSLLGMVLAMERSALEPGYSQILPGVFGVPLLVSSCDGVARSLVSFWIAFALNIMSRATLLGKRSSSLVGRAALWCPCTFVDFRAMSHDMARFFTEIARSCSYSSLHNGHSTALLLGVEVQSS